MGNRVASSIASHSEISRSNPQAVWHHEVGSSDGTEVTQIIVGKGNRAASGLGHNEHEHRVTRRKQA